jgi:hypothetical protein
VRLAFVRHIVSTFAGTTINAPTGWFRRASLCGAALLATYNYSGTASLSTTSNWSAVLATFEESGSGFGGVDLMSGPYAGCPGAGCANGDYRSGADGTVSTGSWVLTTPSGSFSQADVGKRGVALDWNAPNQECSSAGLGWAGWACYMGGSCQFTVSSVNSSTSINVSPVTGCASSGIGFNSSAGVYWAVYSDDSTALQNALNAAAGKTLSVPATYNGGIFTGALIPSSTTIQCASGATFNDPRLDRISGWTWLLTFKGNDSLVTRCKFNGTEPLGGGWHDPTRERNTILADWGPNNGNAATFNTFQNVWGTFVVQADGSTNFTFSNNTCRNTAENCLQMNTTGGTPGAVVQNNVLVDSNLQVEDSANVPISSSCISNGTGCPNQSILISGNDISAVLGCGYSRSQAALGLWFDSTAHLDCGTSASGGHPGTNEYLGVTCSDNHVHGINSALFPAPGTNYPTGYGEVMSNNICDHGCNGTAP